MKLSDPETWAVPVESIEIDDPTWGVVKISRWNRFHFEQSADYPMSIILVQPQGKKLSQRSTTPMWLAWIGEEEIGSIDLWITLLDFWLFVTLYAKSTYKMPR
ncbi:MAG: hypothetical protein EWV53_00280 [Microcystis panniformis Mp_MB_F_20051200_S9]|uniref:Uncharacterized protein n=1 Tax=Microcystis panniformis Mp_MB_F_20051200_S9 TaxID=2486223 RepID=A0A552QBM7_9CHRO|nr:MAG: hypothetical protein EWV87_11015 [Microcystis panniformis Mp_GB_SS_20050300_S99]TRV51075.1 MAG: hypothetical protein EWV43_04820 [Microcystis panniformis Mp_MB_F_20080800_S26D]TRV55047.1 MAG: hypothetical protein EWV42_02580 [Microcystis panniformis Mp_GB_SS_20050300_S99D]TRV56724.1 MAG: hypothetical protein EWV69_17380 [Microcystis panniformis Mp_MB_F_20080800_S26]TRV61906.1 MAG: hypothetical protein EWV86_14320 [Microcystis panniformis Mp_MB_F_20051200_S9D]TRV66630.1 MAG: hypothetica